MRKLFNGDKRGERKNENAQRIVYTATYKVNHSDGLLEFLLRKCNTSRNNVKSLLTRRQVLVNGRVVTQYDFPLAKDDEVKIAKTSVQGGEALRRETAKPVRKREPSRAVKILYEDEDLIAID